MTYQAGRVVVPRQDRSRFLEQIFHDEKWRAVGTLAMAKVLEVPFGP